MYHVIQLAMNNLQLISKMMMTIRTRTRLEDKDNNNPRRRRLGPSNEAITENSQFQPRTTTVQTGSLQLKVREELTGQISTQTLESGEGECRLAQVEPSTRQRCISQASCRRDILRPCTCDTSVVDTACHPAATGKPESK